MGSELDKNALEAAWSRFRKGSIDGVDPKTCLAAAITAYRRALPAPDALVEPTEEQVERVALALLKATYQHYGDPAPKNPDLTLTSLLARAAIAAMREGGGS
jgi:hypothetical protein